MNRPCKTCGEIVTLPGRVTCSTLCAVENERQWTALLPVLAERVQEDGLDNGQLRARHRPTGSTARLVCLQTPQATLLVEGEPRSFPIRDVDLLKEDVARVVKPREARA